MTTLRDPFANVHKKDIKNKRGEVVAQVDYVGWSQSADRLDDVAPEQWSFAIMAIGEDWVHGRLTIGSQSFENIGYAENAEADWKKEVLKDAASDAFKRCAALAGVARYLYDKDAPRGNGNYRPTPLRPVIKAPPRSSTVVPDMPEFPDDWEYGNDQTPMRPPLRDEFPVIGALQPNVGEECPKHPGEAWRGGPGDLFHKLPSGSGYCRPDGQPKKARA